MTDQQVAVSRFAGAWLSGTTCHHQKLSIFWERYPFVLMRHGGHSTWCGGFTGQAWCQTYYALYDVTGPKPDVMGEPSLWSREGRLPKNWRLDVAPIIKMIDNKTKQE
jgi:hypothetical protein